MSIKQMLRRSDPSERTICNQGAPRTPGPESVQIYPSPSSFKLEQRKGSGHVYARTLRSWSDSCMMNESASNLRDI